MEKLVNPLLIKRNLLVASLFITSFEMLKSSIQDRIKFFLSDVAYNGECEMIDVISDDYRREILDRVIPNINKKNHNHLFYSSCLWLKDMNAITQNDIDELQKIRKERNTIAHEPLKLLIDDNININIELLKKSQELLSKIEKWWLINIEMDISPGLDGVNIDTDDVKSGITILLNYFMEIADSEINI